MEAKCRAQNWSAEEINMLIELVKEKYSVLFGKHSLGSSQSLKKAIWMNISEKISALGTKRTHLECKKKFTYLKSDAKKYIGHKSQTGGGPPLPPPLLKYIGKSEKWCLLNQLLD